jgi:hypothetical protein
MEDMTAGRPIGELNGPWGWLLKIALLTYPPLIAAVISLVVWLVANQMKDNLFREAGPRFTAVDAELMMAKMRAELPPVEWRSRITTLEAKVVENKLLLERILVKLDDP